MKYIFIILLVSCKSGEKNSSLNILRNNSDTITLKFMDSDDSEILKNFECKILTYNEIYPNEEDLKKGIQYYPDSDGRINILKKNLNNDFFPKFQVCIRDKYTSGFQRFYYTFNHDDTAFYVTRFSRFLVVYDHNDKNLSGNLMNMYIEKYIKDSVIYCDIKVKDYSKYKLSDTSDAVYFRNGESIKVKLVILKDNDTIKQYEFFVKYKKNAKFEFNANKGLIYEN